MTFRFQAELWALLILSRVTQKKDDNGNEIMWHHEDFTWIHYTQHSEAFCFSIKKKKTHQTNWIHVSGSPRLPVIAPAWLPALLKISVRILCAPEGIQTWKKKSINVRKEAKDSIDWKETGRQEWTDNPADRDRKKRNFLPFEAVLRVPEIAVSAKVTKVKS